MLNEGGLAYKTREDYLWRLEKRLLPFFAECPLDRIDFDLVERYIASKRRSSKPLSPRSLNMTLTLLAAILEAALERDLIKGRNPAKGERRRVKERKSRRSYIDNADAMIALLDAAGALDSQASSQRVHRRAILTVLLFCGLRIGELCDLLWRHVDLAGGWLHVADSKTDPGVRKVKIRGIVRDALLAIKPADADPDSHVFGPSTGGRPNPSNIRNRVIAPAEQHASKTLVSRGGAPLPHLTPHSCRRTFASVLYALGEDPATVMEEMGHTHPALALSVYAQAMRRDADDSQRLAALVDGDQLAVIGSPADQAAPVEVTPEAL